LALYRIAWAQLTGTPLEQIGAAFFYVAGNTTVRPTTLATLEDIEQIMRVGRA
jgi:DNA helicase-2/ATP-dependent DNA helicase PcrA